MTSLSKSVATLSAAVAGAAVLCAVVSGALVGSIGAVGAVWAALVTWLVGLLVLALVWRYGSSPAVVLVGTLLRLVLVSLLAWVVYLAHGGLDQQSYLLSIAVTYLTALTVETWLVLGVKPAVLSLLFNTRMEAR